MLLEYEVGVSGENVLQNGLRSIEREMIAQERRGRSRAANSSQEKVRLTQRGAEQVARAEERANQRAIQAKQKAEERARIKKEREEKRSADRIRDYERRQYHQHLMHKYRAEQQLRRRQVSEQARMDRARKQSAARISRGAGRVYSGTAGSIAGGIRTGAGLLGLSGGLLVGNAVQTRSSEQAIATQIANQASDKADPELRNQLLNEAQQVRGFTGAETLNALSEFVAKTGDLEAARGVIMDLGELALASGSDIADLGATAGQAFNVIKDQVEDPKQRLIEMKSLMAALAQQGALGAVEIRDLARDFGKLGAATRAFEGGAPTLLRSMGAFAQMAVARGGAVNSADASTAAARLANDIVMNQKKFKGIGVSFKSEADPTKLRDPLEIMLDVLDKTKGDVSKTTGLFGQESAKIFRSLAAVYSEGEKRFKGGGKAAVQAEFNRFMGAELSPEAIKEKADLRMSDPDKQWQDLMKDFNREVGSKLIPVVQELIPHLRDLIGPVGDLTVGAVELAEIVLDNPLKSLGAATTAFMLKELAAVGFSSLFERAIMSRLGGGNLPIPGGGGGNPVPGGGGKWTRLAKVGRVAGGAAAATGVAFGGAYLLASMYNESDAARKEQAENASAAYNHYGAGVYSGAVGKDYQQDLIDPKFSRAIQQVTGPSQSEQTQAPQTFDFAKMDALTAKQFEAAEAQIRAARAQETAADRLADSGELRTVPAIFRKN